MELVEIITDPKWINDVMKKGDALTTTFSAGKITIELNFKDRDWSVGRVSYTFPRKHGE